MNNNTRDGATYIPVSLNNEATTYAAAFSGAAPSPTAATAASTIVPDSHTPPSGKKQRIKPFYPVNMKKMCKKDTIDTTSVPDAPTATSTNASSQSPVLKVSNFPYSLRNRNFPTSSIGTKKTRKRHKRQIMIKLPYTYLLKPTIYPLFNQRLPPNALARKSPNLHIHGEIAIFVAPPPPPKQITIDNTITFHY